MSSSNGPRLTNVVLESMPDDGNRYELIDGELYISEPPSLPHQCTLVNLLWPVLEWLQTDPIGRALPGVGVILDDYNSVIPDFLFATHQRIAESVAGDYFRAAPELIGEILSPGASNERRDRNVKLNLYATRGAGEYWIVNPENRSVEIHRRNESGDLAFEQTLREKDELTSPLLPGFGVSVDKFFV